VREFRVIKERWPANTCTECYNANRRHAGTGNKGLDAVTIVVDRGGYVWRPDDILEAIRRFARKHRGRPPVFREFSVPTVGKGGNLRTPTKPAHPSARTVRLAFGSWANAIEAAGFPRPTVGPATGKKQRRNRVCQRGHRITERPNGTRYCRTCQLERARQWRARTRPAI
jgi:hypothetical protein